jgi:hypothetical protein
MPKIVEPGDIPFSQIIIRGNNLAMQISHVALWSSTLLSGLAPAIDIQLIPDREQFPRDSSH